MAAEEGTKTRTTDASTPSHQWRIAPLGLPWALRAVDVVRGEWPLGPQPADPPLGKTGDTQVLRWRGATRPRCIPRPGPHLEEGGEASSTPGPTHRVQSRLAGLPITIGLVQDHMGRLQLHRSAAPPELQPVCILTG